MVWTRQYCYINHSSLPILLSMLTFTYYIPAILHKDYGWRFLQCTNLHTCCKNTRLTFGTRIVNEGEKTWTSLTPIFWYWSCGVCCGLCPTHKVWLRKEMIELESFQCVGSFQIPHETKIRMGVMQPQENKKYKTSRPLK